MVIFAIRMYLFSYVMFRIIKYTMENGKPDLNLVENLYVVVSDMCILLSDLHVNTKEDEALIQNTVRIVQIQNGEETWYPINKRLVQVNDVIVKWYIINNTNNSNMTDETSIQKNQEVYFWFPHNKTLMHLDENETKWIQEFNDTLMRQQRRRDDFNSMALGSEEDILKWFAINNTLSNLMNLYPTNQSQSDVTQRYTKNELQVHSEDHKIHSSSIRSFDYQDYNVDFLTNDSDLYTDEEKYDDGSSIDWYQLNDTFIALKRPNINVKRKTKLIIHGFGATANDVVTLRLAYVYYIFTPYNVLLVDAETVLGKIYFKSVKNARLLGKAIADVIIYLESFGADAADFHLLGVSLGAHVAGWAGQYFRHIKGRRIGRITGLDPAGPCFAYMPANDRLDKTDALYVDVIHTNSLVQGISEPIGHSDFYVNGGGPIQPKCFLPSCSHLYAAHIFKMSIVFPDLFVSLKCDSWSQFQEQQCLNKTAKLGETSDPSTRGLYYIRTSMDIPYGLGMAGIKPKR